MRKFSGSEAQERIKSVIQNANWDYSFQNVPWRCEFNSICFYQFVSIVYSFWFVSGLFQDDDSR